MQPGLAIGEATLDAALALRRVGAIKEWDVLVSNIFEPAMSFSQSYVLDA